MFLTKGKLVAGVAALIVGGSAAAATVTLTFDDQRDVCQRRLDDSAPLTADEHHLLETCVSAFTIKTPTPTPSSTPTIEPTQTPSPTATPTPTPIPTTTPSSCEFPKFVTSSCTGTPVGWQPTTTINGSYTTKTNGQIIDGWLITGSLSIRNSNVVIRNSEIRGTIYNQVNNQSFNGITITDTTVGPVTGVANVGTGAIGVCGYTATRVKIRNVTEGFRAGGYGNSGRTCGPVTIQDSYIKLVAGAPDAHGDGVQELDGMPTGVTLIHNTIDTDDMGDRANAAIFLGANGYGGTVRRNLVLGGGYVIRLHADYSSTTYADVSENRVVVGTWGFAPINVLNCSRVVHYRDNRTVVIDRNTYQVLETRDLIKSCVEK